MTEKDCKIEKIKDGSFRVTRTDIDGDYHTHVLSKRLAKTVIHNVCYNKNTVKFTELYPYKYVSVK